MKKFLLSLAAVATLSFAASAEEVTYDFINFDYGMTRLSGSATEYNTNPCTIENGAVTITVNGENSSRLWTDGLRLYKTATFSVACNGGTISQIEFTCKNAAGAGYIAVADGATGTVAAADKVCTWTGSAQAADFKVTHTSGNFAISTIKVTYSGGQVDNRKDAGLAFSETAVTVELGDPFIAPTLTKATNAAVTYSSDAENVATVDATTGAVSILAVGTARITAKADANDEYKAGSASYLITVKEKITAPEGSVFFSALGEGFSFDNPEGLEVWKLDTKYGLKGSAYLNNQINAAVATAYTTDAIDLTGLKNITLTFKNAFNNYKLNNVMIPVTDFIGYAAVLVREEGAADWTVIDNAITAPEAFSWTFYDNAPVSLEAYKGKKIQVAFRYFSSTEVAGTWEIQRIAVAGEADQTGIEAIEATEAPVEYYNLQGVRVANPENGIYVRRQGNTVTKVVVR